MKNLKAILLIILGSFFIATGFAFAGEAYQQANDGNLWKSGPSGAVAVASPFVDKSAPAVTAAAPEKAPDKTTLAQDTKKWVGDHKTQIFMGAVGAYVGFALFGTLLGACTCGFGLLLFMAIAAA